MSRVSVGRVHRHRPPANVHIWRELGVVEGTRTLHVSWVLVVLVLRLAKHCWVLTGRGWVVQCTVRTGLMLL